MIEWRNSRWWRGEMGLAFLWFGLWVMGCTAAMGNKPKEKTSPTPLVFHSLCSSFELMKEMKKKRANEEMRLKSSLWVSCPQWRERIGLFNGIILIMEWIKQTRHEWRKRTTIQRAQCEAASPLSSISLLLARWSAIKKREKSWSGRGRPIQSYSTLNQFRKLAKIDGVELISFTIKNNN